MEQWGRADSDLMEAIIYKMLTLHQVRLLGFVVLDEHHLPKMNVILMNITFIESAAAEMIRSLWCSHTQQEHA
jgi:hypothetical protein